MMATSAQNGQHLATASCTCQLRGVHGVPALHYSAVMATLTYISSQLARQKQHLPALPRCMLRAAGV
jgi:hypothetical protein